MSPRKRIDYKRQPKLHFWKRDGELFFAERADVEVHISQGHLSKKLLLWRLSKAYELLLDVMDGKRVSAYSVGTIEYGLNPERSDTEKMLGLDF